MAGKLADFASNKKNEPICGECGSNCNVTIVQQKQAVTDMKTGLTTAPVRCLCSVHGHFNGVIELTEAKAKPIGK